MSKRARKRNGGIRKRCGCPRTKWAKCGHPWHFNFKWKGVHYRFSLDREVGGIIEGKLEAEGAADRLPTAIRTGTFRNPRPEPPPDAPLTFASFAETWKKRRGEQLVRPRDNAYRLKTICKFPVHDVLTFGAKALTTVTTDDIERFRDARKAVGLSAVTVNHDLKLLRKMFNWGIRKGFLDRSPFKIGTEAAIALEREIPRDRRFDSDEQETKLLDVANPHLRAIIIALLDTACRPGEILSLQWKDVNLERKEITIQAEKSKTRTARLVPISTRLLATLEMRNTDPAGNDLPPEAYVFGTAIGGRVKSIRTAWENATEAAGLKGFQMRDLRHEAGSRFDEAGVPISYVSRLLGHTNLSTTSRYLNIHRRRLQNAMQKLEQHRPAVAQALHTPSGDAQANVPSPQEQPAPKPHVVQ